MIAALLCIVLFVISVSFIPFSDFELTLPPIEAAQSHQPVTPIVFKEQSTAWGLVTSHQQNSLMLTTIRQIVGSGVCVLDANGDGWEDLFIVGGSGEHRYYGRSTWWAKKPHGNSLWLNHNGERFENATAYSNVSTKNWPMGCGAADFDNDGDIDLFVTYIGSNKLLINDGTGRYKDISDTAGFSQDESWSTSVALADYNRDGLVDIYVTNFIRYQEGAKVFEQASGYVESVQDQFNPDLYNSQPNRLYQNMGDLKFQEVSKNTNVDDISGRGKAARWIDMNNDSYPDLLVLNSGGAPNRLFINKGPEQGFIFDDAPSSYRIESARGAHSITAGDIDRDGDTDLLISSPAGTPPLLLIQGDREYTQDSDDQNILKDLAWEKGLADNRRLYQEGWGGVLADLNSDGHLDLFIGNGAPVVDMDSSYVTVAQPDALWIGQGKGHFSPAPFSSNSPSPTRGVVKADFNHDGKIDLFTTQNNGYVRLLINNTDTNNHWIGITLDTNGFDPTGSKVEVITPSGMISKTFTVDSSYLSQSTRQLHFPLPEKTTQADVQVTWSNGEKLTYPNLELDRYWILTRDNRSKPLPSKQASSIHHGEFFKALTSTQQKEFISAFLYLLESSRTELSASEKAILVSELRDGFAEHSIDVRSSILELVTKIPTTSSLELIRNGLGDPVVGIRKASINALKTLELELSIPWLISLTGDSNAEVRCETAKTFEFLFHEEEAIVKRKGLGIPSLVRMLDDQVPAVRVCAIRALAETESYRAIAPLAKILNSNDGEQSSIVRGNSARALGYIRDRRAIDALLEALNHKNQDPYVAAHCLIALKRLNYDGLKPLLEKSLYVAPSATSVGQQFDIARILLTDPDDRTVLSRNRVLSYSLDALSSLDGERNNTPAWLPHMLRFLSVSNSPLAETTLLRYINHADDNISNTALSSLSVSNSPPPELSDWNFYSRDPATKKTVLTNLLNNGFQPSIMDAKKLLRDPNLAELFNEHILRHGYPKLLALISSYPSTAEVEVTTLLNLCMKMPRFSGMAPSAWFSSPSHFPLRLACWEKTNSPRSSSPDISKLISLVYASSIMEQQLALRTLAKHPDNKADRFLIRLIKDRSSSQRLREYALRSVANEEKFYARGLTMGLVQQSPSPISRYAAAIVKNKSWEKQTPPSLIQIANDKTVAPSQRWPAIHKLALQYDHNLLDLIATPTVQGVQQ